MEYIAADCTYICTFHLYVSTTRQYSGVVGWCEVVMYLTSLGHSNDIALQMGKAYYSCSG